MSKLNKLLRCLVASPALAFVVSGCDSLSGKVDQAFTDCESIRQEIIDLTEKDRPTRGYALVAIYDPIQVSKSDSELKCSGQASWSDQDKTPINYRQYLDQEGSVMIEYDVP